MKLTFDLLVELDLTARPSYNREKFLAYDAFLCGWSLAHPRFRAQGTRPAVVFVCPNHHAALACAREADELMTGRIGPMGAPAEHWYYAGRDHLFFAVEADIHHGELLALALPGAPTRPAPTTLGEPRPRASAGQLDDGDVGRGVSVSDWRLAADVLFVVRHGRDRASDRPDRNVANAIAPRSGLRRSKRWSWPPTRRRRGIPSAVSLCARRVGPV